MREFRTKTSTKGTRKRLTYAQTYAENEPKKHVGDYRIYRHDDMCEQLMEEWRDKKYKSFYMHHADIEHYNQRLAQYDALKEKKNQLDQVKDYSELNVISYKMKIIREEFAKIRSVIKQAHDNKNAE